MFYLLRTTLNWFEIAVPITVIRTRVTILSGTSEKPQIIAPGSPPTRGLEVAATFVAVSIPDLPGEEGRGEDHIGCGPPLLQNKGLDEDLNLGLDLDAFDERITSHFPCGTACRASRARE